MSHDLKNLARQTALGAMEDLEASFPRIGLHKIFQAVLIVFMAQGLASVSASLLAQFLSGRGTEAAAQAGVIWLFRVVSPYEFALFLTLVGAVAGAGLAWYLVAEAGGAGAKAGLGLRWTGIAAVAGGFGFGLALGAFWAHYLAGHGVPRMRVEGWLGYSLWAGYLALGPVCEELYYRGFILPTLMRRFSPNTGLAVMTVGRALLMAAGSGDPDIMWAQFGVSFVLELGLGLMRLFSRSLWPCVAANYAMTGVFWAMLARFE